MNNYCVYMHISPSGKKYIGITSQEPKRRWANGHGYKRNPYFTNAIEKYGWNNFEHIIITKGLTKEEAEWLEIELIRVNDSAKHNKGYNIDLGGNSIGKISEESKQKMSEAKKGKQSMFFGKSHTEEAKEKNRLAHLGKNNSCSRSIICLTTKRIFFAVRDAGRYYNMDYTGIVKCCTGKYKSAGKYNGQKLVWKYLNHKHNRIYRIKKAM